LLVKFKFVHILDDKVKMFLVEVFDYLSTQRENWAIYGMLMLRPSEKKITY